MGLFDAFKKKQCDICGGEIGLLGNRKLEDGNMCKHCARKLSYWFDERRHSTVEQINAQLIYREENKAKLPAFNTTRIFGERTKLHLDEDQRLFLISNDGESNWEEENPDIVPFADVTAVNLEIDEDKTEEKRENSEGEMVSYNPPRYTYYYDFKIVINVRHPYFDEMSFKLNRNDVKIESWGTGFRATTGVGRFVNNKASGFAPHSDPEYNRYVQLGEEIKQALLAARQEAREEAATAAAPKTAVSCPWCGATTLPDANGCCEYCGGTV